jgi:voltage-gated potassium channel Kch
MSDEGTETGSEELKNSTYEIFIAALSVLSIVNIALVTLAQDDAVDGVIIIIDIFLSLVFLCDFLFRFLTAESRREYFFRQFGWADLAASLPLPQAKILRLFRIFRATRLLRQYGPAKMVQDFAENRAQSALLVVFLLIILLLEFGGMGVTWAERDNPDANIRTGSDAIWWAYVTITTVGYGDRFPVTNTGRVIGVIVLTAGVGLFGVLTGFLANFFLAPRTTKREPAQEGGAAASLARIRDLIDQQERTQQELRERLDEFERMTAATKPEIVVTPTPEGGLTES